ncbi:uncharacterized protein SCHCODRAFT_02673947 [Schizophyllum commune H4-8]|nr:uncharacterized protein SCHCODRAFT_02673947 [Schizophyllum commune H4-8]KAI5884950.1 hypothetical protein SCHCODRAFT_02673947 [Schizophyllum commune H4-8]
MEVRSYVQSPAKVDAVEESQVHMHAMGTTSMAMLALHGRGRSRTKYASASCSQQPLGRQDTFFHAKHGRRRRVDGGADLGYSTRSMRAIIFSETGILPILHRRLILALRFFKRMLELPADTIAAHAFRDALELYGAGRPGWIGDLATGLRRLEPIPVHVDFVHVRSAAHVDTIIGRVEASAHDGVRRDLTAASRTHLLLNRVEVDKRGQQSSKTIQYRAYLDVETPHHRKALTRALTGEHSLLSVRGGWSDRGESTKPEWRLCRFCGSAVEDAPHALFSCATRADLSHLRHVFWCDIVDLRADVREANADVNTWLPALCGIRNAVPRLAKYVHDVLDLFSLHRAYVPPREGWEKSKGRTKETDRD